MTIIIIIIIVSEMVRVKRPAPIGIIEISSTMTYKYDKCHFPWPPAVTDLEITHEIDSQFYVAEVKDMINIVQRLIADGKSPSHNIRRTYSDSGVAGGGASIGVGKYGEAGIITAVVSNNRASYRDTLKS